MIRARFIFFFKGAGFITFVDIQQILPVISFYSASACLEQRFYAKLVWPYFFLKIFCYLFIFGGSGLSCGMLDPSLWQGALSVVAWVPELTDSVATVCGPGCPVACGIVPD